MLPAATISVLDKVAVRGSRSEFIDRAIRHYVQSEGQKTLRERLKEEALAWADRDLEMAGEWFPLEEEAWRIERPRRKTKR